MSNTIGYDAASTQPEYDDAVAVEAAIPYCSGKAEVNFQE